MLRVLLGFLIAVQYAFGAPQRQGTSRETYSTNSTDAERIREREELRAESRALEAKIQATIKETAEHMAKRLDRVIASLEEVRKDIERDRELATTVRPPTNVVPNQITIPEASVAKESTKRVVEHATTPSSN